ncbi:hypothetical protein BASA62_001497 [Batrachochytrium salamandrivorans]|nr:hypothetical protein BASA62_001497 [Batrachochytrium salamandrivorans]
MTTSMPAVVEPAQTVAAVSARNSSLWAYSDALTTQLRHLSRVLQLQSVTAMLAPPLDLLAINVESISELVHSDEYETLLDVHEGILALQTQTFANCVKLLEQTAPPANPSTDPSTSPSTSPSTPTVSAAKGRPFPKNKLGSNKNYNTYRPPALHTANGKPSPYNGPAASSPLASVTTSIGSNASPRDYDCCNSAGSNTSSSAGSSASSSFTQSLRQYQSEKPTTLEEWRQFHQRIRQDDAAAHSAMKSTGADSSDSSDSSDDSYGSDGSVRSVTPEAAEPMSASPTAPLCSESPPQNNDSNFNSSSNSKKNINHLTISSPSHPVLRNLAGRNCVAGSPLPHTPPPNSSITPSDYQGCGDPMLSSDNLPHLHLANVTSASSPFVDGSSQVTHAFGPLSVLSQEDGTGSAPQSPSQMPSPVSASRVAGRPPTKPLKGILVQREKEKDRLQVRFTSSDQATGPTMISPAATSGTPTDELSSGVDHNIFPGCTAPSRSLASLYTRVMASSNAGTADGDSLTATSVDSTALGPVEIKQVAAPMTQSGQRMPQVVSAPELETHSYVASVVENGSAAHQAMAASASPQTPQSGPIVHSNVPADMVVALYNYNARTSKEMSFVRGDIFSVRKREGTWIYSTKLNRVTLKPLLVAPTDTPTASKTNAVPGSKLELGCLAEMIKDTVIIAGAEGADPAVANELRFHCGITASPTTTSAQVQPHPFAHFVVECEQVTGHRIQSGLVPAIQKSRLRPLGRALDPGVENVYTWLRGGVLNGEADLDQQWLDGTVEHESMGTRHDNRALAARLADFLQVAYRQYQSTLWKYHRDRLVEVG